MPFRSSLSHPLLKALSLASGLILVTCLSLPADEKQNSTTNPLDRLTAQIDKWVEAGWQKNKVTPAPPADDAEFLRRIYLDLAGRIPSVSEARQFLADKSPNKRTALVDHLLQGPGYLRHFTNVWKRAYLPELQTNTVFGRTTGGFDAWLRERLVQNTPYDQTVRQLLTGPIASNDLNSPTSFFVLTKDSKPENVAAGVSRSILGVRLECAQCHNHPFAKWKQEEFWSFAAFFREVQPDAKPQLTIPGKNKTVTARFLETKDDPKKDIASRTQVADWIVSKQNRFFARAAVNRIWGELLGKGIVDPIDDFDETNPPSHPELLDDLASSFAEQNFDLKFLIRAITRSRAYQLSSLQTDPSQQNPRLFARMSVRSLSVDQLFDALSQATGYYEPFVEANIGQDTPRMKIRQLFQNESATGEAQTSILQALALMNGEFVSDATDLAKSRTLAGIVESPFLTHPQRIEACYLATLSRTPNQEEAMLTLETIEHAKEPDAQRERYSDLFWALLNSSEFVLQH